MPISQNHNDLFHSSDASDKLDLFQMLLNSGKLNSDEALALLNAIHTELGQPLGHDPSVYVRYVRMMEALRQQMPDVHREVTAKWEQLHSGMQKKVTEDYASEVGPEKTVKSGTKNYKTPIQEAPKQQQTQRPVPKPATKRRDDKEVEIKGGEEELEGPEPEEEEAEETENSEKEEKGEEVEKYGEEVEEEAEEEEKESEEKEGKEEEAEEEETEEKEEENEKEETEEVEKEGAEEKEEETEEEEKEEVEEKEEKEEVEQEQEKEETEVEVETAESEEADHRIAEAAEAAEEAEHPEVEVESEEVEINPGEEEPPMEPLG